MCVLCEHMCVHTNSTTCVWQSEDNLRCQSSPATLSETGLCLLLCTPGYLVQGSLVILLSLLPIQVHITASEFYVGSGNQNSDFPP